MGQLPVEADRHCDRVSRIPRRRHFAVVTHQPLDDAGGPVITAKHYLPAHQECDGPACVGVAADWQFDILSGRQANTIDVSEQTFDEYRVGDRFNQ